MEFTVAPVPRDREEILAQVFEVCRRAFPDTAIEKLRSNWFDSNAASMFYGAYDGERLVACNGFIAHDVLIGGARALAFQSCWSATDPAYRGKGLFSRIIDFARGDLREHGGAFICGYPNEVSRPIFTGKLGFAEVPMLRAVYVLPLPRPLVAAQLDVARYFDRLASPALVTFDQRRNHAWKRAEHADVVACEHYTNFLWGRVLHRRVGGIPVKLFVAGGCEINKPRLFGDLLRKLRHEHAVAAVRFTCAEGSLLAGASRCVLAARTEPFIHTPLVPLPDGVVFDAHTGLKDAY